METIFRETVKISLMANWLIIAVVLLRMLLKKAPRRMVCTLWAIVALRLVLPFSIESSVSMIPQTTSAIQEAVDTTLIHPQVIPSGAVQAPVQAGLAAVQSTPAPASVLPLVWSIGVALMLCYLVFSSLNMRRLVREAVPEAGNIWICDAVTTPFILGLFRPRIYLPSGLSGKNLDYVIAHEQSHLRWKDHWWKPLAFVLLSVYWFNPLAWAAYTLVCKDIEFACDERVIRHYDTAEKKAYASALLECSTGKHLVLACPVAFGETSVVQRVRNVLYYKKPRFWMMLVSAVVIAATAIGFLTVPAQNDAPDVQEPASIQDVSSKPTAPEQLQPTVTQEAEEDAWADAPDGIRIETVQGKTFTAHVMLVLNPGSVYLATSAPQFSMSTPGMPMDEMLEQENATAAVNAGYFFDDGTASLAVGSVPTGLTLSHSAVVWDDGHELLPEESFVGFTTDNILITARFTTAEDVQQQNIRDGCIAGPVLLVNGKPNMEVYSQNTGYTRRAAIGQCADGTVLFVCTDGRMPESIGATYADVIDILTAYGAVNACALPGGSSSGMLYRDTDGRYGENGQIQMFNVYRIDGTPILRKLPTFWMVK